MTLLQVLFWSHELYSAVIMYCVLQALCIVSCRLMHCVLQSICAVLCMYYVLCYAGTMHCILQSSRVVLYSHYALCSTFMHVFYSILVFCRHHAFCPAAITCSILQALCIVSCSLMYCVQSPSILFCSHHAFCSAATMHSILQYH
jgi:hypothetical protein